MLEPRIDITSARLTADPEVTNTRTGKEMMRLRFAVNPYHKDRSGQIVNDPPMFFSVTTFDTRLMQTYREQLHKGDKVNISGYLNVKTYQKSNGETATDIQVNNAYVSIPLEKAKESNNNNSSANYGGGYGYSSASASDGYGTFNQFGGNDDGEPEF
jgi:single-strand DNA-binding protein